MSGYQSLPTNILDAETSQEIVVEPLVKDSVLYLWNCHRNFNIALAIFFPVGTLAGLLEWNEGLIFLTNMIAIVALAKMLDLSTEQLSKKTGQTLGALINASFGNAVELVIKFNRLLG